MNPVQFVTSYLYKNNFNIILFSTPYVFQVLLGLRVTITYEDFSPFIVAVSDDQIILKFPVHTSSITEEINWQYSPSQIVYLMESWRCGLGRNAYLLLLVILIPPVAVKSGLKQVFFFLFHVLDSRQDT